MKKKIKSLLLKFKKLNLPEGKYAIYGSAPMAVRNLRDVHDLDVVVESKVYKELLKKYKEVKPGFIKIGDIEIFDLSKSLLKNPKKVIRNAQKIKGFYFASLQDIIDWKRSLGREKDLRDIELIKNYLKKKNASEKSDFKEKVLKVVAKIPAGKVLTYKEVAEKAGSPKAWRVVGNILSKNKNKKIPCHRVVRSDYKIGGYNRGSKKKKELLEKEGVLIKNDKVFIQRK